MKKTPLCCNKPMEAKGICWSEDKGYGESDYAVLLQCKRCNKMKIINVFGGRSE